MYSQDAVMVQHLQLTRTRERATTVPAERDSLCSRQAVLGGLDRYMEQNEITFSHTTYKNKLKMDQQPKCKTRTTELLEGKYTL